MPQFQNDVKRIIIIGFGSIGQGVLPLLLRHLNCWPSQVRILSRDISGCEIAARYNAEFIRVELHPENFAEVLDAYVRPNDFVLNLAVGVSSACLIDWCQQRGVLYIDTSIEPWRSPLEESRHTSRVHSNHELREKVLRLRNSHCRATTAVIAHGANPGIVTHFVKQALLNVASDCGMTPQSVPRSSEEWSRLASETNIKAIQVAERDTQHRENACDSDELINSWSVEAIANEFFMNAELGWGTHEKRFPEMAVNDSKECGSAIKLSQCGLSTRVATWTPSGGPAVGFLVSHNESISICDYLTLRTNGKVVYRPSVHFAYCPTPEAVRSLRRMQSMDGQQLVRTRILNGDIISGMDELGVLLTGHSRGAYWYGTTLTIDQARSAAPGNNATTLPVAAAIVGGMIWALQHPEAGIVESSEMDFLQILEFCEPYLGSIIKRYTTWTPLTNDAAAYSTNESGNSWQFHHFLRSKDVYLQEQS